MTAILLMGFLVGLRHALEADHVAAVAVLTTRARSLSEAVPIGVMWGLGHTLTLFVFAGLVMASGSVIPGDVAGWLEGAVGVMLILLGGDVIRRLIRDRVHFHAHTHAGENSHFHAHSHKVRQTHRHDHVRGLSMKALLVGMVHGMAGSAALALLTAQTVGGPGTGVIYIALFGIGSVVGMGLLTAVIAVPLRYTAKSMTWAYSSLSAAMGLFSMGLGVLAVHGSGVL